MTLGEHAILIKGEAGERPGVWYARRYTPRERFRRAAMAWALAWLGAALSVPIIIAHFILVPLCLIAGPVLAYRRYRTEEIPDHVSGQCPAHQQDFTLPLEDNVHLPMWAYCPDCQASLQLLPTEP